MFIPMGVGIATETHHALIVCGYNSNIHTAYKHTAARWFIK